MDSPFGAMGLRPDPALEALLNPWAGAGFQAGSSTSSQETVYVAPPLIAKRPNAVIPLIIVLASTLMTAILYFNEQKIPMA